MAEGTSEFDVWLSNKLCTLNTDDEIFSPYIKGILESDDTIDEKKEALVGILSEIVETNIEELCVEFLEKWAESCRRQEAAAKKEESNVICLEDKLAKLLEDNKPKTNNNMVKKTTSEKEKLKQAILAQYAEISEDEEDNADEIALPPARSANVEAVHKAVKAKREEDKEASHKKKEKDKEDRAKQKSKSDDRKEKEKKRTQKGEKRR